MREDYEAMLKAYSEAGGTPDIFKNSNIAHLIIHKNKVIGKNLIKGLTIVPEETAWGIEINLKVEKGIKIENPVHLCFGVLTKEGIQEIKIKAKIEDNGGVKLLAHCIFPDAVKIVHKMDAEIEIGNDAYYEYKEVHYHGKIGGVEVIPQAKIKVGKNSHLLTNFSLLQGRVGVFDLNYETEILDNSSLNITTKIYGYGNDKIKIKEVGHLKGRNSRGLLKSRIVVKDEAESEIINELIATAPEARGHVDCVEIIQGNARAKAIPIVNVANEFAKVTHEAAIGRLDKKEIETLMSRGLDEEEAIDLIISKMLQ